ncbi:MAG: hypothetical protein HC828_14165, partial [Blastochloris sp.]|nr:hypothetical protein [Blastochloris sp.]
PEQLNQQALSNLEAQSIAPQFYNGDIGLTIMQAIMEANAGTAQQSPPATNPDNPDVVGGEGGTIEDEGIITPEAIGGPQTPPGG